MAFRVGQKVVCVDAGIVAPSVDDRLIVAGQIYEVRWYGVDERAHRPGPHVRLSGIDRPSLRGDGWDVPYCANRFRPLVEKSTDTGMAILREILDRETIKDRAPVRQQ